MGMRDGAPELLLRVLVVNFLLAWTIFQGAHADNHTNPISIFRSRPDLRAPIVTIYEKKDEFVTPGYIFIAPYQAYQEGPYIYDNEGNLVWTGFGVSGPWAAHAVHVCDYLGSSSDHLCFFQGHQMEGYARGHGIIMDNKYRIVRSVEPGGATLSSDMHEFNVLPGGRTAVMTIYKQAPYDLNQFGIANGVGYILEGLFQEVDIESGDVIFEWRSLDHVDPSESFVPPGSTPVSGTGLIKEEPWDYFHINSIDKNADGDYLISARHVSCIYKLSGKDGSILWQLQGKSSTFHLTNFHFSSQHDARWLSENASHTVLSLFDNASDGFNRTKTFSQGLIVVMDHMENTATAIHEYNAPDVNGGLEAKSQGNTQVLPNGNIFQGWGNNAFFSEHTADGTGVWYGSIALTGTMIYRCYKFNWTATPNTSPSLWTYSKSGTDEDGMAFYVSWNGATEVERWNFYTAKTKDGPYDLLGSTPKRGFETTYKHDEFSPYSYAEALDKSGRVLKRGVNVKTFVPGPAIVASCDSYGCVDARVLTDEEKKKNVEEEKRRKEEQEKQEKQREAQREEEEEKRRRRDASHKKLVLGIVLGVLGFVAMILLAFRKAVYGVSLVSAKNAVDYWSVLERRIRRVNYRRVPREEP